MAEVRSTKGQGSIFQLPDGRWRAQVDLGVVGGKRLRPSRTCRTQREARAALRDLRQRAAPPDADTTTVGDWLSLWLDTIAPQRVRPDTLQGYRNKVELHVLPEIGAVRLKRLTPEHLERVYAGMLERGLAQSTVVQTHAIVRRALHVALDRGRIDKNPADRVELRKPPPNPHAVHTADECLRILNAARDVRESARLHLALSAGLRQSEALALDWGDVHETDPMPYLTVRRTVAAIKGRGLVITDTTKSGKQRHVYLTPAASGMLAAWRQQSGGVGLVFPASTGGPITAKVDSDAWHAAEDRAGVPRMPLHGARGALVSRLFEQGVQLEVAAEILGHASTETTRRHYLHIGSPQHYAAMKGLDR